MDTSQNIFIEDEMQPGNLRKICLPPTIYKHENPGNGLTSLCYVLVFHKF